MSAGDAWVGGAQLDGDGLLDRRLESDPDSEYLDVCGVKVTRRRGRGRHGRRLANGLAALGRAPATGWRPSWRTRPRRARLVGDRPRRCGGRADQHRLQGRVPAPPARGLGLRVLIVEADLVDRAEPWSPTSDLEPRGRGR